jgi:hypothetical protein
VSPETKKSKKLTEIHFKPEGYVSTDGIEFLEQLVEKLRQETNLNPDDLIYSGTGAEHLYNADGSVKRPNAIFAMNETGWVRAAKDHETTPAGYADSGDDPRIALYDRSQLAHAYSYRVDQDETDYYAPVHITDIVPGDALAGRPSSEVVNEVVIHKDYPQNPDASPADALLGIVVFEHE